MRKPKVANVRLANKVIWGLEDITAGCKDMWDTWRQARDRAEAQQDAIMLGYLAQMSERIAFIERKTRDARQGEYDE